jgi:adenylate cyclase
LLLVAHRGIIDKSIGDSILSFFGFDNEDKKSGAHDVIMAALELRQKFENIKRKWIEIWSKDLDNSKISLYVKCEINSGTVLFGSLDTNTMSQVTILESPVDLANKLESVTKKDQIIISPDVKELIQGEFELQKFVPKKSIQSYAETSILYEVKPLLTTFDT